ncbi:hypothetical protein [Aquimarina latercula]|uniref:hypothetical protein n=1 Tax=Aquimarina latercula TaxID=987 RepID=UPI00041751B8|nr:hypothetical protein [Aquimarina latercula]
MEKKEHQENLIHFASLVNLAFVDNEFDSEEYLVLESLAQKLNISKEERTNILESPESFAIKPIDSFSKRLEFIFNFFNIIYADHKIAEQEYELVKNYISGLGFNEENTQKILKKSIRIFERKFSLAEYEKLIFED